MHSEVLIANNRSLLNSYHDIIKNVLILLPIKLSNEYLERYNYFTFYLFNND